MTRRRCERCDACTTRWLWSREHRDASTARRRAHRRRRRAKCEAAGRTRPNDRVGVGVGVRRTVAAEPAGTPATRQTLHGGGNAAPAGRINLRNATASPPNQAPDPRSVPRTAARRPRGALRRGVHGGRCGRIANRRAAGRRGFKRSSSVSASAMDTPPCRDYWTEQQELSPERAAPS